MDVRRHGHPQPRPGPIHFLSRMFRRNFTSIFAALIAALLLAMALLVFGGCASTESGVGKAQARSHSIERKISANQAAQRDRLQREIFATRVALENQSLGLALDFNTRAQSIVGLPPAGQMADVRRLVAGLLSENAALREKAQKLDAIEVAQLNRLQEEQADLTNKREVAIGNERTAATKAASELGNLKAKVNSWFGLGGVFYGLKRFGTMALIGFGGLLVLFGVLSVIPATAPAAIPFFRGLLICIRWLGSGLIRFVAWAFQSLLEFLNRFRK